MSNQISPTVKHLWKVAMHACAAYFSSTAYCLGQYSLHLLIQKSSTDTSIPFQTLDCRHPTLWRFRTMASRASATTRRTSRSRRKDVRHYQVISVTRFGEISSLWQFYDGLFRIWQKLLSTLANFIYDWAIFHGCKWTNHETYKSHLVILIKFDFQRHLCLNSIHSYIKVSLNFANAMLGKVIIPR